MWGCDKPTIIPTIIQRADLYMYIVVLSRFKCLDQHYDQWKCIYIFSLHHIINTINRNTVTGEINFIYRSEMQIYVSFWKKFHYCCRNLLSKELVFRFSQVFCIFCIPIVSSTQKTTQHIYGIPNNSSPLSSNANKLAPFVIRSCTTGTSPCLAAMCIDLWEKITIMA